MIGELFRNGMLKGKIVHYCISTFLKSDKPNSQSVECLINILKNVGNLLDAHRDAKPYMNAYFERLEKWGDSGLYPNRIKFMCQDICKTRKNKWKARHPVHRSKTKEEIRRETKIF